MRSNVIYVSGPLTQGDLLLNVRRAVTEGMRLRDVGYIPIIPHLSAFVELMHPRPYEYWMQWDFSLIEVCDTVLRLEGDSPGGDREVQIALDLGKRVLYGYAGMSTLLTEATEPYEEDDSEDESDTAVGDPDKEGFVKAVESWHAARKRIDEGARIRVRSIHSGVLGTMIGWGEQLFAVRVKWDGEDSPRDAGYQYLEEI